MKLVIHVFPIAFILTSYIINCEEGDINMIYSTEVDRMMCVCKRTKSWTSSNTRRRKMGTS